MRRNMSQQWPRPLCHPEKEPESSCQNCAFGPGRRPDLDAFQAGRRASARLCRPRGAGHRVQSAAQNKNSNQALWRSGSSLRARRKRPASARSRLAAGASMNYARPNASPNATKPRLTDGLSPATLHRPAPGSRKVPPLQLCGRPRSCRGSGSEAGARVWRNFALRHRVRQNIPAAPTSPARECSHQARAVGETPNRCGPALLPASARA